jgi:hypothetical protein
MMNFRLIGAAALSLVLATPAMAMHQRYHLDQGRVIHSELPVLESPDYGDGSTYGAYNLSPHNEFSPDEIPAGYDPVPPSANGG